MRLLIRLWKSLNESNRQQPNQLGEALMALWVYLDDSPSLSTACLKKCCFPRITITISSKCQISVGVGQLDLRFLAIGSPNF